VKAVDPTSKNPKTQHLGKGDKADVVEAFAEMFLDSLRIPVIDPIIGDQKLDLVMLIDFALQTRSLWRIAGAF